jgi:hypothetical protein
MEYLIGLCLALVTAGFARVVGFDRERAFYPTVIIVIATYYILFAAISTSARALFLESVAATVFLALATIGYKKSAWLVPAAMAAHGVFDLVHHSLIVDPGVPQWWPGFCLAFDATLGAWIAIGMVVRSQETPLL